MKRKTKKNPTNPTISDMLALLEDPLLKCPSCESLPFVAAYMGRRYSAEFTAMCSHLRIQIFAGSFCGDENARAEFMASNFERLKSSWNGAMRTLFALPCNCSTCMALYPKRHEGG